ncbi:PD-(D/E)XK nuclease-like domain-containing protein [Rickettsiella endosymbiont of Dermanyssus gallinae]|uniref:PD-(D/E)XK nuclease-like domain-containing protein n=1 Tax=Rickettsiella endosymbiont of Dermanyssus gallinae TaxID=2856608 RepID=UPI001FE33AE7|nr:PD-(D/E)XK nuclease-like domain-containing protein [Rickettsiella endosymbiont of Dermanyssus gallinae]
MDNVIPNMALNNSSIRFHASALTPSKNHMEPGIYDISNEAYHRGSGISRSGLMEIKKHSPYHYWYKYLNSEYVAEPATPAQLLGNALHTFILEPKKFEKQFFILPKFDKRTKAGAERWQHIQKDLGNKVVLSELQYQELQAMADSFKKNKIACQLIENAQIEQSLYWTDPSTDTLCKCRPDILRSSLVADLKTTQDGSAFSFSKAIYDYGYHIQAAMIREALRQIKQIDVTSFWFIVIEKSPPYVVSTYKLDEISLKKGYEEFKYLIARYKHCLAANDWPAYETQEISLPKYAFN